MAATVYHLDLYGTREDKYEWLRTHTLADLRPAPDIAAQPPVQSQHQCRGGRCPCRRAFGDVFTGRRTFRRASRPKKSRVAKKSRAPEPPLEFEPPLSALTFGPLSVARFPEAVPVPAGVYQGLCRTLLQIHRMLGPQKFGDASLAVQVADTLQEEATATWIRDHVAEFRRGCGDGFTEQPQAEETKGQEKFTK